MEIQEKELTPLQGLQMITDVIAKTRENLKEHSFCFLLWGWLIAAASFLFFILHAYTSFTLYFLPFPVLTAAGIFVTLRYYAGKRKAAQTYLGYYLGRLWLALASGFILAVAINLIADQPPFTYTLLIAGIGTLASGLVLRFRPLTAGGILFLLASLISIELPDTYKPLLQGLVVVMGYLIPGYLLQRSTD